MLTGDLQIAFYRQGKVFPKRLLLKEESLNLAEDLIQSFKGAMGFSRERLEEELKAVPDYNQGPKVFKGLCKILFDRSSFNPPIRENMAELRAQSWDGAAQWWQQESGRFEDFTLAQSKILAGQPDAPEGKAENWLFADMVAQQILIAPPKITQEELIHRYNLEQLQGLLMQASKLTLTLSREGDVAFRQVMQWMKFFRLLFRIQQEDSHQITLEIEGSQAVLENPRSYGLELANFFPALLLLESPWELKAQIGRAGVARRFLFEINQQNPYEGQQKLKGVYQHEKLSSLIARFKEKYKAPYRITLSEEPVTIKGGIILLPDLTLKGPGGKVQVEWLRYLTPAKLEWLKEVWPDLPKHYIFVLKAKGAKKRELETLFGDRLLCFANELTAPSLKRLVEKK